MHVTNTFNRLATVQASDGTVVPHKLSLKDAAELGKAADKDNDNGCCSSIGDKGDLELKRLLDTNPGSFELQAKCTLASRLIAVGIRLNCDQNPDQIAKK